MLRNAALFLLIASILAILSAVVLLLTADTEATRRQDFFHRIDVLMAGRKYSQAEAEVMERYPNSGQRPADAWLRLGLAQSMQDDFSNAMESFDAGLATQPEDPRLMFNRALLFDRMGQPEKAEAALLDLKKATPHFPEVFYHLGRLAEDRGDLAAADAYYVQELNLNPASQSSWKRHLMIERGLSSAAPPASNPVSQ